MSSIACPDPRPTRDCPELKTVYVVRDVAFDPALPQVVLRIVELLDGRRDLAHVASETQISEDRALNVIRKLTRLGLVGLVDRRLELAETLRDLPSLRHSQAGGFTAAEEAFFSSEVEPIEEGSPSLGARVGLLWADLRIRLTGAPA